MDALAEGPTRDPEARTEVLQAALGYAALRLPVLPVHAPLRGGNCSCRRVDCSRPAKHPLTKHGVKDATTDPGVIRECWRATPFANVGIATGPRAGLIVLDIDHEHGGETSLQQLIQEY